ncbi:nucleotide-binding protein [Candidatus Peregrinibacteria bacterium]|nr:nucleotide-binding protein [Candidatus Peregrinibacteria bacterium]
MQKGKYYYTCKFSIQTIRSAHAQFLSTLDTSKRIEAPSALSITKGHETWEYDTVDEFLAEYNKADDYYFDHIEQNKRLIIRSNEHNCYVLAKSKDRGEIEAIFQIFESKVKESTIIVEKDPIKIFIGHGHDDQWRDLKDHLHEKQGLDVIAYEIGPRAGLSVKEVLEKMMSESSFALLVLTGEDIDSEGNAHARENVIHELGLFQGKIGFKKAIAMLEKDVNEFSNILGVNQVRFAKGNIKETFGEVISIIKREFE